MSTQQPSLQVAVVMRKVRITGPMSRWQPWRWELADVVAHEPAFGTEPRRLRQDENGEHWLHPNFTVELFRDDAEGYYLNATTPAPCWFVLWRMEEEATVSDEPIPRPAAVSVSYHDAGRWLDAQETVEQVPAPPEVVAWFQAYADEHYKIEPKKRKRPDSFKPLTDRFGNPASVSTEKKFGGGEHG
ncbi:DUF3305 domain-containing protein [Rhodoferax sp. BAB1]|uniref:DUF3305 domain-containing protein n=1 Tax=Rhodoferax sp. BAB1 TaxID=2741720 RepID=UPI0015759C9A|nr:DUF3305 domain-containing protein [Rhodoferax sp. BAB1]QKO22647.1 DUF3305 domain-containing protein [Rhodoferax sp. BAB1]